MEPLESNHADPSNFCWVETLKDGILPFKNVTFSVQESLKPEKEENEYPHTEENVILDFESDQVPFNTGLKYFHQGKDQFCTIEEREEVEGAQKPKFVKVKFDESEAEAETIDKEEEFEQLLDHLPIKLRILSKTGVKSTAKGEIAINDGYKNGMEKLFASIGLKIMKYKIFHGKEVVKSDASLEKLYKSDRSLDFFCCECLGKPSKWRRFEGKYGDNTWSNSGRYHDRIVFVPTKDIIFAGFSVFSPKDDPKFWMKYKIEIDEKVVFETEPKEFSEFEDEYYCRVHLEEPMEVRTGQKIKIIVWIQKTQTEGEYIYSYYGTNGSSYDTYPNEHMGLFTLEEPGDSGNGTSIYSGQIPEILYHL